MPFFEPMVGQVTGVSTATLRAAHGEIVARGMDGGYQFIQLADGVVYGSVRWGSDAWLPWGRVYTHSPERFSRHMGIAIERAP